MMRNFRDEEFACPCCKKIELDPILATRLDCLRDMFRAPLLVNSGYRCESHNKKVGGSPNSQHLLGKAADISTDGMSATQKHDLMAIATRLGFQGLGVYPKFFHLDVRTDRKLWVLSRRQKPGLSWRATTPIDLHNLLLLKEITSFP